MIDDEINVNSDQAEMKCNFVFATMGNIFIDTTFWHLFAFKNRSLELVGCQKWWAILSEI